MRSRVCANAMLLVQSQGTIYSKPTNTNKLPFEQKQTLGAKEAIFSRGFNIASWCKSFGACADNAI